MTDETMTFPEVLRQMAENVEAGRPRMAGMEHKQLDGAGWYPAPAFDLSAIQAICEEGSIRRKPRTIEVAGIKVPEPMRSVPEYGTAYWFVDEEGYALHDMWTGKSGDHGRLGCGNAFVAEYGARARAEVGQRLFGKRGEE